MEEEEDREMMVEEEFLEDDEAAAAWEKRDWREGLMPEAPVVVEEVVLVVLAAGMVAGSP